MIQPETPYADFLERAAYSLRARGAQELSLTRVTANPDPWISGWDRVLLDDAPGAATLFAFTDGATGDLKSLDQRIDRLAVGLSTMGMLQGPGLRLVAVVVFPEGMGELVPARVTGITPRYLPGLRPQVWAADLREGRLYHGRRAGEAASAVSAALSSALSGEVLDASGMAVLEREQVNRTAAFYRLMQGRRPVVTYALIAVNVAVFLLMYRYGSPDSDRTLRDFGGLQPRLIEQGQWWRLCAAIFLHAGIAHILFNMTSLFALGTLAERFYGSGRFLAIYLGAGLIGSLSSFGYAVLTGELNMLGVGASGAIFGLAGALMTLRFQRSDVIPRALRNRVSASLIPLVFLNLFIAAITPHIDNSAHVGGLIGGALLSLLLPVTQRVRDLR